MRERPILFTSENVRKILSGQKTQTRRVVKPTQSTPKVAPLQMEPWLIDGEQETDDDGLPCWAGFHPDYPGEAKWFSCPHGGIGDRLWVREAWTLVPATAYRGSEGVMQTVCPTDPSDVAIYKAGWVHSSPGVAWRSPMFMPRWASRLTLEITEVRVERLQTITTEDIKAEGIQGIGCGADEGCFHDAFVSLWDSINGKTAPWESDPYVWVIGFTPRREGSEGTK